MIDTSLVPFAIAFFVIAAVSLVVAVAGIAIALRDRSTIPAVTATGRSERVYARAA